MSAHGSEARSPASRGVRRSIHPDTRVGAVRLEVADLERMQNFYERAIGLTTVELSTEVARLGVGGAPLGAPLVELVHNPVAAPRPREATGLYHLAILVPSRVELARAVRRVAGAGWSFSGASDHLVSEALYLDDPEGNGIEIYRDRRRDEWGYANGELRMSSLPLDLEGVLAELDGGVSDALAMATGTTMGHVHLQVADLERAEDFYHGTLGLDVTVRSYPGALFLSAGGYHHHIGLNTWAGRGAPAPPPGARGLRWFEILVPTRDEYDRVGRALGDRGAEPRRQGDGLLVSDPSGNGLLLRARQADR
jgi:catechol 2,3-dioxygenase